MKIKPFFSYLLHDTHLNIVLQYAPITLKQFLSLQVNDPKKDFSSCN